MSKANKDAVQKQKLRMNIVDILFIAFIVLLIAGAAIYFNRSSEATGEATDVYFSVEIQGVDKGMADSVKIGDEIKDSIKGYYLGVVQEVKIKDSESWIHDEVNNKFIRSKVPDKYTVIITVKGKGMEDDANIYSEGQPVKMGKEMSIKGKGYAGTGYVVELLTKKEGA